MSPRRSRYVTLSQQVLALGVVVAALVPATRVVSLDIVSGRSGTSAPAGASRVSQLAADPLRGRDRIAPLW